MISDYEKKYFNPIKLSSEDGVEWTYSPLAYWSESASDKFSFFAYSPFDENYGGESAVVADNTLMIPAPEKIDDCRDYLVADSVLDQTRTETVQLNFKYIFTYPEQVSPT